ncbi:Uu.00g134090.m01.CDS01 [Anthostomella pinea]|uniref:Uu.00g134090.m01.CDS01 n=1 Tax=Anthostomella pinea TaxID=933095 RepID=A0AAI8VNY7_9PEZI|nr:Uu.00g134090.m01.CDS01 [Anthostomella pinea]
MPPHTHLDVSPPSPEGHVGYPQDDPVCIVGMACRLPGGVRSPADMWQFLLEKKSAQGIVPLERYNIKGFYSEEGDKAGVMNVEGGYFLQDDLPMVSKPQPLTSYPSVQPPIDAYKSLEMIQNVLVTDTPYAETQQMDPQQRKLLEVVFECLENSGTSRDQMSGSNTGVYVGNFTQDHLLMQVRDPDDLRRYHATGAGLTMLANRISHAFNLHGPSLTLDTACSSSIYCLHLAVAALQAAECDGAIVAASNLIMMPTPHVAAMKAGMLSPTSTCHTFDVSADGYARAEAVDAIYLKRLSTAIQDNDTIHAIVRGTATNSNGHGPGVVYPSSEFQEAVMRKAYQNANLDFCDTDYVETHGTGTELGDIVELTALASCFLPGRSVPLKIGGSKPSFGHSEAASSLTSIIKVAMAFQHGILPPTRGIETLNPKLELSRRNIEIVTKPQTWPRDLQRASICSSGYGGANAHAILESFSSYCKKTTKTRLPVAEAGQCFVLPVSAASRKSLETRAAELYRIARSCEAHDIESLCYTLSERVTSLGCRTSLVLTKSQNQPANEWTLNPIDALHSGELDALDLALVFTGQGAQYHGMGKELLDKSPIFLATIRDLDQVIRNLPPRYSPEWTLEDTMRESSDTSLVHDVARSQPLCTAIQVALVNIVRSWGIGFHSTVGYSSGEIAAAYASGLISASQAILTAYFRGYAVAREPAHGAMLACGLAAEEAELLIHQLGLSDQVCIACINAANSVTLSGLREHIHTIHSELIARKEFSRLLETGGQAYHSPWMKAAGAEYEQLLRPYFQSRDHQSPSAAIMYSTVKCSNNGPITIDPSMDMARYWRDNLESPVQFESALSHMIQKQRFHLLEIGPRSALKGPISQIRIAARQDEQAIPYSSSLIRSQDAHLCMQRLAARLFVHGHELEWQAINSIPEQSRVVFRDLPPYPWDYSAGLRWFEPRASIELRNRTYPRHELLGSQQLAGNGVEWSWRNVLRGDAVPWLRDHKIESQVIFPAAGYLAVAMEAATRLHATQAGSLTEPAAFEFENVAINSAMVVPDEDDLQKVSVELHTTMSLRKISATAFSANIYDFTISSWAAGQSVVHCVGNVKVSDFSLEKTVSIHDAEPHKNWTMEKWQERFTEEGIFFGPYFRSLTGVQADKYQIRSAARCTTQIHPPKTRHQTTRYAVHPLTIDACLQATLISASRGNPDSFRGYVPVFISQCRIQRPQSLNADQEGTIHAQSQETGVSTLRAECVLEDPQGLPVVEMGGVKLSRYMGRVAQEDVSADPHLDRHPVLRVQWKPDITRLASDAIPRLEAYIEDFVGRDARPTGEQVVTATIGALLDLAGHRNPRMHLVSVGTGSEHTAGPWLDILGHGTAFPRLRSWQSLRPVDTDRLAADNSKQDTYDVLVHEENESQGLWGCAPHPLISLVKESGIIITRNSDAALAELEGANFSTTVIKDQVILAVRMTERKILNGQSVLLLGRKTSPTLERLFLKLKSLLMRSGAGKVDAVYLDQLSTATLSGETVCISLLEIVEPFVATLSQNDLELLQGLTSTVNEIFWLTGADMLGAPNPDLTLVRGLARALMVEQPSLRLTVMDVGSLEALSSDLSSSCDMLIQVLQSHRDADDTEFIISDGLLYISRFEPDIAINSLFRRRTSRNHRPQGKTPLSAAQPATLSIGTAGLTDTIYFRHLSEPYTAPPVGYIDVQIKAVSLNAKDVYTMSGHVETRTGTSAIEFGGLVTAVGPGVRHLQPGDRVVVLMPNDFSTTARVPSWTAHKLLPGEELTVMATLPTIYCTALYAIQNRAHLRSGESILVHSGAGALGIAVIAIAQRAGAVVYTTAGSEARRKFLVDALGIPAGHVFNSRDDSFTTGIETVTKGRGVDVVVNSLVGDLMHASWRCLAPFGRFVEVGKREIVDNGMLEMHRFARSTTFTAFDLSEMFFQEGEYYEGLLAGLVRDVFEMYRSGQIRQVPTTTFDVSQIAEAYRYFSSKDRIGKIVVSLEDQESLLSVAPSRFMSIFNSEKVYLLVGALGGLGQSLTQWMMSRGAKRFVFLQRSGCDKPGTREFVDHLQRAGALLTVVKGDVTVLDDVAASVAACRALGGPLGGVVQAAMGLHEDLFSRMTSVSWHASVRPKWAGTWNLHAAIDGYDESLDFFLMTSSMNGTVGLPTESNYCAANAFLDAFAFWRRSQGKPATSLGLGMISEVGYVHQNPDIEALLLRRGTQPLSEDDFLQLVDLSLGGAGTQHMNSFSEMPAHMLSGLETTGIRKFFEQGFEVSHSVINDPRSSILAAALEASRDAAGRSQDKTSDIDELVMRIPWLKGLPKGASTVLGAEKNATTLKESILSALRRRFSHLLLTPMDNIDNKRPFAQFGIDSMIAAEFRTWLWNSFKVDVPFLDLLSHHESLGTVAEFIEEQLLKT